MARHCAGSSGEYGRAKPGVRESQGRTLFLLNEWTTSDSISSVTLVKVDANMAGYCLEGLKQTRVTANEVAMELGQIESWDIYVSELPQSGHFNVSLVVRFKDMAQYEKGRKEFAAFEEAWLKKISEEKREEIVKSYPNIRKIVGEHLMRKAELK